MSTPTGNPTADDDSAQGTLPNPPEVAASAAGAPTWGLGPAPLDGWDSELEEAVEFSRHVGRL